MKITSVLACLAATVIVATATALPAQADTTPQRLSACGQTITGDSAYLDRDLTCAQGFVTPRATDDANRLSVDLRGHRLSGTGSGTPFSVGNNDPYFDSIDVKNGRVDHWGTAFFAAYASITITNVTIDHNDIGLYCGGSTCTVSGSRIQNNKTGTTAVDSALTFDRNLFSGNGVASDASSITGASGSTYTQNVFDDNTTGIRIAATGSITATKNMFTRNTVGVLGESASESDGYGAGLTGNTFRGNRDGVRLTLQDGYDTAALKGNIAVRNTRSGIHAPGATDLGGNRTVANGKLCRGVVCTNP